MSRTLRGFFQSVLMIVAFIVLSQNGWSQCCDVTNATQAQACPLQWPQDYYCPGTHRLNLPAVLTGQVGSAACRRRLIEGDVGELEALLEIGRNLTTGEPLSGEIRSALTQVLSASHALGTCSQSNAQPLTLQAIYETGFDILPGNGAQYCQVATNPCSNAGGRLTISRRTIANRVESYAACRLNGFLIDSSCLNRPLAMRRLLTSVQSVSTEGLNCLRDAAPNTARALEALLDENAQSLTRFCCGMCQQRPDLSNSSGVPNSAFMLTEAPQGLATPLATISLSEDSMRERPNVNQAWFNSATFHELLHRLGLCSHFNHNGQPDAVRLPSRVMEERNSRWTVVQTSCPEGYTRQSIPVRSSSQAEAFRQMQNFVWRPPMTSEPFNRLTYRDIQSLLRLQGQDRNQRLTQLLTSYSSRPLDEESSNNAMDLSENLENFLAEGAQSGSSIENLYSGMQVRLASTNLWRNLPRTDGSRSDYTDESVCGNLTRRSERCGQDGHNTMAQYLLNSRDRSGRVAICRRSEGAVFDANGHVCRDLCPNSPATGPLRARALQDPVFACHLHCYHDNPTAQRMHLYNDPRQIRQACQRGDVVSAAQGFNGASLGCDWGRTARVVQPGDSTCP